MAKRSARVTEVREKSEISCMWGLFSILESCQGHSTPKLISNGRPISKHFSDNQRKLIQPASFDEECRKIKNEADLGTKEATVKGQKSTETEPEPVDHLSKTHSKARKKSQKVNQSSSYHLNNAASLIHQPASASASTSAEVSLNKLKFAAILEAFCAQNNREEITLSEDFRRTISSKALTDQMFIERKFLCKDGTSSGSQSFSNALEVLKPNKDLWQKIDYQYKYSSKTSFPVKKPSDKIVILKPAPLNAKYSENVKCHCLSMQSRGRFNRRTSDAKIAHFFFREMKKKLKHRFRGTRKDCISDKLSQNRSILKVGDECTCHGVEFGHSSHNLCKRKGIESKWEPGISSGTDKVRRKLDFSSGRFTKKQEFDVVMEAKRHLSTRLKNQNSVENPTSKKSSKTLGRILSSPEHDIWPHSPRRDGLDCSASAQMRFSPYCLSPLRPNKEVTSCDDYDNNDSTLEIWQQKKRSSLVSNDEEGSRDAIISKTDNMKCNGELKIVEVNSIPRPELHVSEVPSEINSTETIELPKEDENDSLSENETFTYPVNDFPSTPSSIYHLDMADSNKHQEEHRSPVSVLEPFFIEDANSPPSITPRTRRLSHGQPLQPLRLDFEEYSSESLLRDSPIHTNTCTEDQYYISDYVHLVFQASCLNWDNILEMIETRPLPEELLHASLFDELIEFLAPTYCYFDAKLLFDHMNEVLQEIYQSHFCLPPWLAFVKPRIQSVPLEEVVLDEIMNEADFYLLPQTEKRTLDQLVSKDMADCRSWLDVRHDTEQIVIDISEDLVDRSILDVLLELHI
ncbi:hypothetical protein BUALT_Bualt10G0051700 [Buddleja alternifolia]|uniref:DUF4378 domain-containing protein n=1 Tax=Buddleja alternifolia TaxID=168488 RepID=A0AAV6X3G1_9LAMI|nr:hypothetical protein BUALT_Bualt10G0051700 [Buddleja alternifolia]